MFGWGSFLGVVATTLMMGTLKLNTRLRQTTSYFCPHRFKDMNRRQMGKLFNANTMTIPSRPQTTDVNYLEGMYV